MCLHSGLPGVFTIKSLNLDSLDESNPPECTVQPLAAVPMIQQEVCSLSPCGTIIQGLQLSTDASLAAPLHWQLHAASARTMTISGPHRATMADHSPLVIQECLEAATWHPVQSACLYAVGSNSGGVFLIDARANRCVMSWTEDELHGHITPFQLAEDCQLDGCTAEDLDAELHQGLDPEAIDHALEWSKDGRRLAVTSGASLTTRARCSILHFGDSFSRTFAP